MSLETTSPLLPSISTLPVDAYPKELAGLQSIPLEQYWRGAKPNESAHTYVGHSEKGLRFYTWCEEKDPYTTATEDNQKLFMLGSVVEFFIHPHGTSAYWEIHLSPNGLLMDIKIPHNEGLLSGSFEWDELISHHSGATCNVTQNETSWCSDITIPWSAFQRSGIPIGENWGFSVCRYNYPGKLEDPELSSTSPFTKVNFHRINEFRRLLF